MICITTCSVTTCLVNSEKCKAREKNCVACQKLGHFPQSSDCKARRKSEKKNSPMKLCTLTSKPEMINKENMKLILKKIKQLEMLIWSEKCLSLHFHASSQNLEESRVPKDLIPFVMMYIYLNYI